MNGARFNKIAPEALSDYVTQAKAHHPHGGILALVAEADREHISDIQALFNTLDYPLVGAVFPALLDEGGFYDSGVVLLTYAQMPSYALYPLESATRAPQESVDELIARLQLSEFGNHRSTLCMIFDSMIPNIATLLDTLYLNLADRVNYAGVNAGSETFQPIPCLFDREQFIQGGVLAMVLPEHPGAVLEHGYRCPSEGLTATATFGNRVSHIDWRPAIDVYDDLATTHYETRITRHNFYEQAVHFPLGIMRADGEVVVRIPVALEEDGSLFCVGEVPENTLLTVLQAADIDSSTTVEHLSTRLAPLQYDELLLFYCAGRRMHMGGHATAELTSLSHHMENKGFLGALSLGEIGQTRDGHYPVFQNATLVGCPWVSQ